MQKEKSGVLKSIAICQIWIIVFAVFSFAFILYSSRPVVAQTWYNSVTHGLEYGPLQPQPWLTPYTGPPPPSVPIPPGTTPPPGEPPGFFSNLIGDTPFGTTGLGASLVSGLIYGGIAYGVGYLIGSLLGLDDNVTSAASAALDL